MVIYGELHHNTFVDLVILKQNNIFLLKVLGSYRISQKYNTKGNYKFEGKTIQYIVQIPLCCLEKVTQVTLCGDIMRLTSDTP